MWLKPCGRGGGWGGEDMNSLSLDFITKLDKMQVKFRLDRFFIPYPQMFYDLASKNS
jgi:hypothetical protein